MVNVFERFHLSKTVLTLITAILIVTASVTVLAVGQNNPGQPEMESIIVGFEGEIDRDLPQQANGVITNELEQIGAIVVDLPVDRAEEALSTWDQRPNVDYVEVNGKMHAHDQEIPWGVERIGAPDAHETSTGKGIGIAILDTGIDPTHETLEVAGGKAFVNCHPHPHCVEDWDDDHGHGTHVAGTSAASDNDIGVLGTAPAADLYAVKVLDNRGSGTFDDVADGIMWAADEDIEVISMSLGGGHSDTVQDAVDYAHEEGSLQIASAGNDGPNEDSVNYPAGYEEVIAVSATDQDDDIADFSSRGEEVELAAPGVSILSTVPEDDYDTKSGTSMAAPHVSGTAALVWALEDFDTHDEVRTHLQETAECIGLDKTEQGHGLVNAAEAVGVDVEVADVTISPGSQEEEAWPEEDAVYEFTVENTGDVDDTYEVSTSSEWESYIEPESISLNAGESEIVEVTHSVPEDAEAGESDIGILEVVSDDASDTAEFTTTARGYAVEIDPELQEGSGEAGDTVEYDYTVSNTGTEDDEYDLAAVADAEEWDADVEPKTVVLEADDSEDVTVSHTIPDDAEDKETDTGTLTAESKNASAEAGFETIVQEVSEPEIITFDISTRTTGPWYRVDVEWEVYHEDGELEEVTSELLDGDDVVDTKTTSVSGESASGEHGLRTRDETPDAVRLTVTDTQDQEASEEEDY